MKQLLLSLSLSLWLWLRPVSYHDSVSQVTTNEPTEQRQRSAAEGRGEEGGEGKGGEGRDKEAGREARYGSWLQTRSRWSWLWSLARSVGRSFALVRRAMVFVRKCGTDWLKYYSHPIVFDRGTPAPLARARPIADGAEPGGSFGTTRSTPALLHRPQLLNSQQSTGGGIVRTPHACIENNSRTGRQTSDRDRARALTQV